MGEIGAIYMQPPISFQTPPFIPSAEYLTSALCVAVGWLVVGAALDWIPNVGCMSGANLLQHSKCGSSPRATLWSPLLLYDPAVVIAYKLYASVCQR
jgi:hypothetical protein